MKKIIFFLLLNSCATNNLSTDIIDFDKDLSFDEFKELVIKYSKISKYPDIDK